MVKTKETFFEKIEAEVVKGTENFIKEKIKKKILHIGEISILIILGFILISFGLASILETYFPILEGGFSFLILGILFLVISYLMKI